MMKCKFNCSNKVASLTPYLNGIKDEYDRLWLIKDKDKSITTCPDHLYLDDNLIEAVELNGSLIEGSYIRVGGRDENDWTIYLYLSIPKGRTAQEMAKELYPEYDLDPMDNKDW